MEFNLNSSKDFYYESLQEGVQESLDLINHMAAVDFYIENDNYSAIFEELDTTFNSVLKEGKNKPDDIEKAKINTLITRLKNLEKNKAKGGEAAARQSLVIITTTATAMLMNALTKSLNPVVGILIGFITGMLSTKVIARIQGKTNPGEVLAELTVALKYRIQLKSILRKLDPTTPEYQKIKKALEKVDNSIKKAKQSKNMIKESARYSLTESEFTNLELLTETINNIYAILEDLSDKDQEAMNRIEKIHEHAKSRLKKLQITLKGLKVKSAVSRIVGLLTLFFNFSKSLEYPDSRFAVTKKGVEQYNQKTTEINNAINKNKRINKSFKLLSFDPFSKSGMWNDQANIARLVTFQPTETEAKVLKIAFTTFTVEVKNLTTAVNSIKSSSLIVAKRKKEILANLEKATTTVRMMSRKLLA